MEHRGVSGKAAAAGALLGGAAAGGVGAVGGAIGGGLADVFAKEEPSPCRGVTLEQR